MLMKTKYLHAPWHDTKSELPDGSGRRCVCFLPMFGCEVEMIFHRSRKESGYKDFFTECASGGRAYDYDHIKYWRYYADKDAEMASEQTKERIRKQVTLALDRILSKSKDGLEKILAAATEYELKEYDSKEKILTALMEEAAGPFVRGADAAYNGKFYSTVDGYRKTLKH